MRDALLRTVYALVAVIGLYSAAAPAQAQHYFVQSNTTGQSTYQTTAPTCPNNSSLFGTAFESNQSGTLYTRATGSCYDPPINFSATRVDSCQYYDAATGGFVSGVIEVTGTAFPSGVSCVEPPTQSECQQAGYPAHAEKVPNNLVFNGQGQSLQDIIDENALSDATVIACVWDVPVTECTPVGSLGGDPNLPLYCQEFTQACANESGRIMFEQSSDVNRPVCVSEVIPEVIDDGKIDEVSDFNECMEAGGVWQIVNGVVGCSGELIPWSDYDNAPDLDSDGIPDTTDPDIDGDGILNDFDDDRDGDGTPNIYDPTPNGANNGNGGTLDSDNDGIPDADDDNTFAYGGGSCVTPPSCGGDAIQCEILRMQWRTRCASENVAESVDDLKETLQESSTPTYGDGSNTPEAFADSDGDGVSDTVTTAYERLHNAPIVAGIRDFGLNINTGGSCPAPEFSAFGETFAFDGHCQLYDVIAPILSSLMIVLYSISAFRIFASA